MFVCGRRIPDDNPFDVLIKQASSWDGNDSIVMFTICEYKIHVHLNLIDQIINVTMVTHLVLAIDALEDYRNMPLFLTQTSMYGGDYRRVLIAHCITKPLRNIYTSKTSFIGN